MTAAICPSQHYGLRRLAARVGMVRPSATSGRVVMLQLALVVCAISLVQCADTEHVGQQEFGKGMGMGLKLLVAPHRATARKSHTQRLRKSSKKSETVVMADRPPMPPALETVPQEAMPPLMPPPEELVRPPPPKPPPLPAMHPRVHSVLHHASIHLHQAESLFQRGGKELTKELAGAAKTVTLARPPVEKQGSSP